MAWFERFTSKKGKDEKSVTPKTVNAPKKASSSEQEKKAFAAVSGGQAETKPADQPTVATKSEPKKKIVTKESTHRAGRVLLSPVVTEKSTMLGRQNQYVFAIAPAATKTDVRQAVQHVYGIRPTGVTIVRLPGKVVRYGRTSGRTAARKKAVVSLPAGKTIDLTVS